MAKFQEISSISFSSCSWENRISIDAGVNTEGGARDVELYEEIEAPKFVDFTVPDNYRPDDRYWFCSRVGCDQRHEEEMDDEAIYKNFIMRVMAARSPNVRLRKALDRNASRTPLKCPRSAPPKSTRPRLAIISSTSRKIDEEKKEIVKPIPKPGCSSTPKPRAKQVASKYLTTPRNKRSLTNQNSFRSVQNREKPANIEVTKSRTVAKTLVFKSPKKTVKVKTSIELRTPITKLCEGMDRLEITSQRKKRVLVCSSKLSSKNLGSNIRSSGNRAIKYSIKSKIKGKLSEENMAKKSSVNGKIKCSKTDKISDIKLQESTREKSHASSEMATNLDLEVSGDIKFDSETCGETIDHVTEDNSSERTRNEHEFVNGDDKENVAVSDENSRPDDKDVDQNGRKNEKCGDVKKVIQEKNLKEGGLALGKKFMKSKPTNPKPFRLRTDERGILKEAKLEKRTDPLAPQSDNSNSNPLDRKLQKKQWNDNQDRGILKEVKLEKRLGPQSDNAKPNTLDGKLQKKQCKDNQKRSVPRGQESTKSAICVRITTPNHHSLKKCQEPKPTSSPLESNAIQRLEKFRKTKPPPTLMPQRIAHRKEKVTSFLIPGQKLDVIHESSPGVSERVMAGKKLGTNDVLS